MRLHKHLVNNRQIYKSLSGILDTSYNLFLPHTIFEIQHHYWTPVNSYIRIRVKPLIDRKYGHI